MLFSRPDGLSYFHTRRHPCGARGLLIAFPASMVMWSLIAAAFFAR